MTQAADLMRREFFAEFPPQDDGDIFCLTDWEDVPATERMAWIRAFTFAFKLGYNKGGDDAHQAMQRGESC